MRITQNNQELFQKYSKIIIALCSRQLKLQTSGHCCGIMRFTAVFHERLVLFDNYRQKTISFKMTFGFLPCRSKPVHRLVSNLMMVKSWLSVQDHATLLRVSLFCQFALLSIGDALWF